MQHVLDPESAGSRRHARRRHAVAIQATRLLARDLVMRSSAPAALDLERALPSGFEDATTAIEAGSWGAGLERLGAACSCERLDLDILGLLVAPEIDPELRSEYHRAFGASRGGLDLEVLRGLLDPVADHGGALLDALDVDAPLRRYELVQVKRSRDGRRTLRAAPRVSRCILDFPVSRVDEALRHAVKLHRIDPHPQLPSLEPARTVVRGDAAGRHQLLVGPPGVGQEEFARAIAIDRGRNLLVADVAILLDGRDPASIVRLALREARICDAVPLLVDADGLFPDKGQVGTLARVLARLEDEPEIVLYATRCRPRRFVTWLRDRREPEPIVLGFPCERHAFAADQHAIAAGSDAPTRADLVAACRDDTAHQLGELASRVDVAIGWDEIVLSSETKATLDEIIDLGKHRTLIGGSSVLFSGEPGTGKRTVAALVAQELGAELYRIDLSRAVSDEQLDAIFAAASASHVALLFDEVDSRFASCLEARSSPHRFLQSVEEFDGLAILTTSLERSIDEAFVQRIRFRVHFPKPEVLERVALWRALIPRGAQVSPNIDLPTVAERFALSGGSIRNAVLRAASLATAEGAPIRQDHLERSAERECEELGRIARRGTKATRHASRRLRR
jgi:MoxR-like ATPase